MNHRLLTLFSAFIMTACSHPIEIIGEGDVLSTSGNRDCTLEAFESGAKRCSENLVIGAYKETYYATPREGWQFNGWGNYCKKGGAQNTECGFAMPADTVADFWGQQAPPLRAFFRRQIGQGLDGLYIGHSFFAPFETTLRAFAPAAGYTGHDAQMVFGGGDTGSPIKLWESPENSAAIKAALDEGGLDLLGMTYFPIADIDYNLQGYVNWVTYALDSNPDATFFIALPWGLNPESMSVEEFEVGWDAVHKNEIHYFIDQLRQQFPDNSFFCIPYGQAATELRKRLAADQLPGVDGLVVTGAGEGIFVDAIGHPGVILVELGTLVWLGSIYGADLTQFDYQNLPQQGWKTGFPEVDLAPIANAIISRHNHDYDSP